MNKGIIYLLVLLVITTSVFAKVSPCNNPGLSCVDAIKNNCLTGSINGGNAKVTNNAAAGYNVGFAIYQVFDKDDHDKTLEHQVLFDSDTGTVGAKNKLNLAVELPGCQYQIDLFCGDVLQSFAGGVRYGDKKLGYYHKTTGSFCTQQVCGDSILGTNEQCDDGNSNGIACNPLCESSCSYCTSDCKLENVYGGSCGGCVGPDCGGNNNVPFFPGFTIGLAVIGAGLGIALLRKQH